VLQPLLKHAWTLWQLLITAQPLMVVGLTPRCAAAVMVFKIIVLHTKHTHAQPLTVVGLTPRCADCAPSSRLFAE
jgi:hypothetical protein